MANPALTSDQNLLPVQAYFALDGTFQTFIGQGQPFYATVNPFQSGLIITNSTIDSTTIGATTPSTGVFTNVTTTTGTIYTTPANDTDIANKAYVDATSQGLSFKQPAKYTTTGNITLSGLATQGGGDWPTALTAGMRILVKNQTSGAENGIYLASATGWTRSLDANTWDEIVAAYLFITSGTVWAGSSWVDTNTEGGTLGVTPVTFVQFSNNATYTAGTGLTLAGYQFSITPVGTAGTYGSASQVPVFVTNASGQVTSVTNTNIAIAGSQITSGTIDTARISGSYTGITGVGTLTAGTWNASTIGVAYGGTGATTLTGYVKGSGTSPFTASTTVPTTDLSGTITNAQLANSTISGVSLGSNLFSLTIGSNLSGTSYNGSSAVTITNTAPMVYPATGIPSSTGSAWGTSYSTTGSGSVLALATGATLNNPIQSTYEDWTANSAPTYTEGRLWYDSTQKALSYYNDITNNAVHIGQETQLKVHNNTGSTINKGVPVYITSTSSEFSYPNVALAKADTQTTGACIGLTNASIANGADGYVVLSGLVTGVNTGSFTVGDVLYVSPYSAGQLMNTYPPTAYAVKVGVVAYSNASGSIYVNQSNAYVVSNGIVGQVAIANGGTNGTATPTAGGIAYGSGTAYAFTAVGTTGQVLTSNGSGTPTWSTPTAYATVTDDTTTNATRYPLYASATSGNLTTEYVASTKYQFNPFTGVLTATGFSGSGAALTSIPNSALNNSSVTIGSTSVALGATVTTFAGLTSVTSTTFVGALTGNASTATSATTATNATNIAITDNTSSVSTYYPVISSATTGNVGATTSSTKLSFVPNTGTLTATNFAGLASSATNIAGGANLQIPYNTGAGATSFIAAPTLASTFLQYNGTGFVWATSAGVGTVTSVGQTFTGGLISVSGSPITTTGTLALTVAGTSGGIVYFSSASTWASSAVLAANALMIGGGAGVAPSTITTGTGVVTALGVNTGSSGAFVVNGGALGTPSSGTVTNLTGTASININGTVGATTANTGAFTTLSFNSGYGSVATAYGCRAWVNFVGSTAAISGNGNVSSITRNAAGDYTINFTNAMPDANYAVTAWARSSTAGNYAVVTANSGTGANSTASAKITVRDTGPNLVDPSVACVAIFR